MPLVSVVIPAYNSASYLPGAIDSVLRQSLQDFEIIIVDDGSKDSTAEVAKSYLSDSRIRYHFQANRGLPGARNAGAKIANGDYFAFLDADDFLAPNALEAMVKAFRATGAAWLNVGVLKIDGEQRTVRHPQKPRGDLLAAILEDDFITRSPFYPKEPFLQVGMYDEEMRNREDWDINIRMILAGMRFENVDEPLYEYTRTAGSITTGNKRKLFSYTEQLLRKHHKHLADTGNPVAAQMYAKNLWHLARRYFYEVGDKSKAASCAWASFRYDPRPYRLFHPLIYQVKRLFGKNPTEITPDT